MQQCIKTALTKEHWSQVEAPEILDIHLWCWCGSASLCVTVSVARIPLLLQYVVCIYAFAITCLSWRGINIHRWVEHKQVPAKVMRMSRWIIWPNKIISASWKQRCGESIFIKKYLWGSSWFTSKPELNYRPIQDKCVCLQKYTHMQIAT